MRPDAAHEPNPVLSGGLFALIAAVAFGVTTPLIQKLGREADPFPTASLLYAGAFLVSLRRSTREGEEAPVRARHVSRLVVVAVLGAVLAPACLAWGLRHTSGISASLLLNFEAVFTVLLGWRLYREHIGARILLALASMLLGGVCLILGGISRGFSVEWGALAVVLATLGWALDNAVTRPLADLNPSAVVMWKAGLGVALALAVSLLSHQRFPRAGAALGLVLSGAAGYGLSLRLYLLAQRRIGAARTGSIFALGPFVGALVALAFGERAPLVPTLAAALLFGLGLYLHLSERHHHEHAHEPIEHEHAHSHDDGHHDHRHDPPVTGVHSHSHRHDARVHQHPHASDVHHLHRH